MALIDSAPLRFNVRQKSLHAVIVEASNPACDMFWLNLEYDPAFFGTTFSKLLRSRVFLG